MWLFVFNNFYSKDERDFLLHGQTVLPISSKAYILHLSWRTVHTSKSPPGKAVKYHTPLCSTMTLVLGLRLSYKHTGCCRAQIWSSDLWILISISKEHRTQDPYLQSTIDFNLTAATSSPPQPSNHGERNARGEKDFEKGARNPLACSPHSNIPALHSQIYADHELWFTATE